MRAGGVALVAALALAGPAAAQDAGAAETLLRGCIAATEADDLDRCIGTYSRRCAEETAGGESNAGLSACAAAETERWDGILHALYAELVVLSKRRAAAEGEAIAPAPLEGMLRAAQRAWIAFRDADCEHDTAIWGEGSQRQVAGAVCLLERTATRVGELRGKLDQMRGA